LKITTILEDVVESGRSYAFEEDHALHVSKLSLLLFDQSQHLHEMGNTERIWLRIASLLHDVGKCVNGTFHNKASRDIIIKKIELPFRKRVRKMIGLIARYHRGGLPNDTHKYFRRLNNESKQCVRKMAALLRLADALDAEHGQIINHLSCEIRKNRVILNLTACEDINIRKLIRKADLFEQVFNKRIEVKTTVFSGSRQSKA
jgi:exopolyphosphatase / guanosine-5'-triphosphate,3'-diphosphate pyrophosphatase